VARLLGAQGRVLPMSDHPLDIEATVSDQSAAGGSRQIRGQVAVAGASGRVEHIRLVPEAPPACAEAVQAVLDADWVVLGPGSWFTSVIPHLLVPELRQALVETGGRVLVVLNLAPQDGETPGFDQADHLSALLEHAPALQVHTVLADIRSVPDRAVLEDVVKAAGARLVVADIAADDGSARHDPAKLAAAYDALIEAGDSPRG
jgi:uncharacterized cofD-like protein